LEELAMRKVIMIGCDLHDESMILKIAEDRQTPEMRAVKNSASARTAMIADLRRRAKAAGGARVVFAYEASGQGFGLYDQLTAAGIECHVLAPTRIARSTRRQKEKTDEKDALDLLELLRAHILAGNRLPTVWIPDAQTRDDRELVRMRLDVGEKITALKAQVQSLLKRCQLRRGPGLGKGWTKAFRGWLQRELADPITSCQSPLGRGGQVALASLLRQLQFLEEEEKRLDEQVAALACSPRYEAHMRELTKLCGVGVLTAIVFLTELGDLGRFANRRQIAAYLGLAPSSNESGEQSDRKGHITHQGSARVRKVLCQATWARMRYDEEEKIVYERIKAKNPKKRKIAVVASMRRLAVRMWHRGKMMTESATCGVSATG
jgi:transposase